MRFSPLIAGLTPLCTPPLPPGFSLETGGWAALKPAARAVRHTVFVIEQQIPVELEWDEWDETSLHAVIFDTRQQAGTQHQAGTQQQPVGTGRLLPAAFDSASPLTGHIGRMAVIACARRSGIGGVLLQALMRAALQQGFGDIVLHAQSYVAPFYARHGYVVEGDEFMEAGIPHRTMRAVLTQDCAAFQNGTVSPA